MSKNYTEAEIANLIETFNESVTEAPVTTRRTAIAERVAAPASGYAVEIAGHVIEVEAETVGDAVLKGRDGLRGTVPNVGGYVFLWSFSVTDTRGVTLHGEDPAVRLSVEVARINAGK